ncbi:sulfite exporter TauE/SafE family protein [Leptospira yasudae]|uniref:Probable membrane transporter protein n=1 Tax=Leptospira yasudae TaxID=2202201 RepID=A0A6N4QXA4_9LEPT|nr:sulfite exporter TauE/SafE family protein [Leptospira yasudae]TGL80281.1 sulfite exporter TauE/SafE family protein [Leptospira yasudae]TGL82158.1 sulfite exporter TauE/SafE family protein [Leptospira yasudae]TGL86980.1 sulfite exporter TauE/SafE family protein [Leptospira yasudae]
MLILGYITSFAMGTSIGLIGAGGSILMVPILFYFFEQDAMRATTNSLFVVGVTALIGALINMKKGNINGKIGILFAIPSFIGIYVARHFLLPLLPNTLLLYFDIILTKSFLIMIAFAVAMIGSSWMMIRFSSSSSGESTESNTTSALVLTIGIKGLIVGLITGFVGAGGGFLIIPALVLLLRFTIQAAIGTSLAIIAANSLFGFTMSFTSTQTTDCPLLLTICSLGIGGMFFGQILSSKLKERSLKKGFGYFVFAIASFILLDQVFRL